jgi:hypothetical protein
LLVSLTICCYLAASGRRRPRRASDPKISYAEKVWFGFGLLDGHGKNPPH